MNPSKSLTILILILLLSLAGDRPVATFILSPIVVITTTVR